MRTFKNILWGLVLIVLGILLGGKALGLWNINVFFKGWWTLFIIVPSFIGLFDEDDKTGSFIGLIVGIILLLSCRDIIDFSLVWKLILPIILVVIGLSFIFKDTFNKEINKNIKKLNKKMTSKEGFTSTFSGQNINFDKEEFKGTTLNAVFGGIELDLRKAIINGDVVINATSIFGGINVYAPKNCRIKIKSNSIFGGVSNQRKFEKNEGEHTIYINASCIFGGVEIL